MRTSSTQFEMMVTFMEQHGDLSKPCSNARGRINNLKFWEELVHLLNSDGAGDSKTLDKWKKVWSDFKNNTKKKAARLHRAVVGTGGGPANLAKLSDLEQRLLRLIGQQVATGLEVEEAGLTQAINIQPPQSQPTRMVVDVEFCPQVDPGNVSSPIQPLSQRRAVSSPPLAFIEEEVHRFQPWNEPGPSTAAHVAPVPTTPQTRSPHNSFVEQQVEGQETLTPTRPTSTSPVYVVRPEPALSGQTTPCRVRPTISRGRRSRRRVGPTPAHTEQAAQHFLQADEYWRKFKLQQHRDYIDIRREQNRIRELEVQATIGWQAIGSRILDSLEKIVNKYCKD